jgi:hypothetical protein
MQGQDGNRPPALKRGRQPGIVPQRYMQDYPVIRLVPVVLVSLPVTGPDMDFYISGD